MANKRLTEDSTHAGNALKKKAKASGATENLTLTSFSHPACDYPTDSEQDDRRGDLKFSGRNETAGTAKQVGRRSARPRASKVPKPVFEIQQFSQPLNSNIFAAGLTAGVHIILHPADRNYHYILDAGILSRASQFFKDALSTSIDEPGKFDAKCKKFLNKQENQALFVLEFSPKIKEYTLIKKPFTTVKPQIKLELPVNPDPEGFRRSRQLGRYSSCDQIPQYDGAGDDLPSGLFVERSNSINDLDPTLAPYIDSNSSPNSYNVQKESLEEAELIHVDNNGAGGSELANFEIQEPAQPAIMSMVEMHSHADETTQGDTAPLENNVLKRNDLKDAEQDDTARPDTSSGHNASGDATYAPPEPKSPEHITSGDAAQAPLRPTSPANPTSLTDAAAHEGLAGAAPQGHTVLEDDSAPGRIFLGDTALEEAAHKDTAPPGRTTPDECSGTKIRTEKVASKVVTHKDDSKDEVIEVACTKVKKPPTPQNLHIGFPTASPDLCDAYNSLFLIFYYGKPKLFSKQVGLTINRCSWIIRVAKKLGCISLVLPHVHEALSNHTAKDINNSIKETPTDWLVLSEALKSERYFSEAMVHIVGNYPYWPWKTAFEELPGNLRGLIEFKAYELREMVNATNEQLFMATIIDENNIPVSISANEMPRRESWVIVQLWRDWFASSYFSLEKERHNRGQLYRIIGRGSDAYLQLEYVEMIARSLRGEGVGEWKELNVDLKLMKDAAKLYVKKLCINRSLLDVEASGIRYLTCVDVKHEELPWTEGNSFKSLMNVDEN